MSQSLKLDLHRRRFLQLGSGSAAAFLLSTQGCGSDDQNPVSAPLFENTDELGDLLPADANGVRLPAGFKSRIIARSSKKVEGSSHAWHGAPDGGACFEVEDGGWIYVSNCEQDSGQGGVGAIRFNREGEITDSYPILDGTHKNCAGGKTPWQTWLSCEEIDRGLVYECDPSGQQQAVAIPALGRFKHEAVAVDPVHGHLFLTEDETDGRFYRFIPDNNFPDISAGTLQVAEIVSEGDADVVRWHTVEDALASLTPTRRQVPASTGFLGGEGIAWHEGTVYFTTKHDNRVWAYETATHRMHILYDAATSPTPILTGVDNVTITASGDVVVAEDGGDMQLVLLTPQGAVLPLLQIVGHDASEITGPAFSPDFSRLYFSSQDGAEGLAEFGVTYEISRI